MTCKLKNTLLLLITGLSLTSCLTRRNALPPGGLQSTGHRGKHAKTILTDASTASKDVPISGQLAVHYARVLGIDPDALQNTSLYAFINDWMGTQYRMGGTDKNGLDCSAFTNILFREIYKVNLPRTAREMAETVHYKKEEQLEEGDLLFFSFESRFIDHVGIYLQNHKFVHVSTSRGVIISDLDDEWYHKYFKEAGSVL